MSVCIAWPPGLNSPEPREAVAREWLDAQLEQWGLQTAARRCRLAEQVGY